VFPYRLSVESIECQTSVQEMATEPSLLKETITKVLQFHIPKHYLLKDKEIGIVNICDRSIISDTV
jgi:hypothetical protein